ncbi:MAG: hypothetical protein ACLTAX_19135 [Waltera sp.]
MKKELKRLGTLMLAAAMSVSGLTACGGKGNETGAATEVTATGVLLHKAQRQKQLLIRLIQT